MNQCRMCGVNTFSEVCTWCFENDSNWKEIKNLRQQNSDLKNKCKAADELAEFYGDFESWEATGWDAQDLIDDSDIEDIEGEDLPKGGKRARQFKKDYPKTEEV